MPEPILAQPLTPLPIAKPLSPTATGTLIDAQMDAIAILDDIKKGAASLYTMAGQVADKLRYANRITRRRAL